MADEQPETGTPESPETGGQPETGTQGSGTTAPGTATEPVEQQPAAPAGELAKWKALARKNELQAKSNSELLEAEKAARSHAEREALAAKVALEAGLPPALADRLKGDDEQSLRADAEQLKQFAAASAPPAAPVPQVGGPQGPPVRSKTPADWLDHIRKNAS